MQDIERSQFTHRLPLTVRWGEMDALGHVNNTVYYRYSEDGRIEYFQTVGVAGPSAEGTGPILADLRCSFRSQLRYPAEIEILTRTARIGNSSLTIQQALFEQELDSPTAVFHAVVVWFDYARQGSARVPETIRANIRNYERQPPEE